MQRFWNWRGKRSREASATVPQESDFPDLSIDDEYDILSVQHWRSCDFK